MAIMQYIQASLATENIGSVVVFAPKGLAHTDSTAFDTNHTIVPNVNNAGGMAFLNAIIDQRFDVQTLKCIIHITF